MAKSSMDRTTTPPPSLSQRSSSRLRLKPSISPSRLSLEDASPSSPLPMHQLLLLSHSPLRKSSKTRLSERLLELPVSEDPVDPTVPRRKCKSSRNSGSPRVSRRTRRRVEGGGEIEREAEEVGGGRARKRRNSAKSKKDEANSVPSPDDGNHHSNLDRIEQMMSDLVMWNDVAKSSLWFGFGCLSFLSSCFTKEINFSIFSFMSKLGLFVLGFSFISNSICQRNNIQNKREFKITEEDILKAGRVILPTVNFAISKTRDLFSGEPYMTLKVVPFLLIGAEYGHVITLRRLFALGFFVSFSCPKLYSCYSLQINSRVEGLKRWAAETWGACSHKKIVSASAATAFWNLTSIRTRIFAAFLLMVILRYHRQHSQTTVQDEEAREEQLKQSKALVVVETASEKQ